MDAEKITPIRNWS